MKEIEKLATKYAEYTGVINNPVNQSQLKEAFIAGAKSQSMSDWVSVETPPKVDITNMVKVIGWNGSEALLVDYYQHKDEELGRFRVNCLKCFNDVTESITHYMELPPPPQTSK